MYRSFGKKHVFGQWTKFSEKLHQRYDILKEYGDMEKQNSRQAEPCSGVTALQRLSSDRITLARLAEIVDVSHSKSFYARRE